MLVTLGIEVFYANVYWPRINQTKQLEQVNSRILQRGWYIGNENAFIGLKHVKYLVSILLKLQDKLVAIDFSKYVHGTTPE